MLLLMLLIPFSFDSNSTRTKWSDSRRHETHFSNFGVVIKSQPWQKTKRNGSDLKWRKTKWNAREDRKHTGKYICEGDEEDDDERTAIRHMQDVFSKSITCKRIKLQLRPLNRLYFVPSSSSSATNLCTVIKEYSGHWTLYVFHVLFGFFFHRIMYRRRRCHFTPCTPAYYNITVFNV